jgi:hypothetical protein
VEVIVFLKYNYEEKLCMLCTSSMDMHLSVMGESICSMSRIAKWKVKIVRFEVFTAMTVKSGVFWDVRPCGSCKNRRFGGT